jgi:hypothetical protein
MTAKQVADESGDAMKIYLLMLLISVIAAAAHLNSGRRVSRQKS